MSEQIQENSQEKEFSPEESLQLIRSMISKTKDAVAVDSFYFLFWGWLVFACCAVEYVLMVYFKYPDHSFVWWSMPVGGIISGTYSARQARIKRSMTYIEEALSYLWIAIGLSFFVLVFVNIVSEAWKTAFTYYILMYAIGTFVSGKLIRFKPLVIGGILNFILAAVSIKFNFANQLLIGALAILISYIIPGHLLRIRYNTKK
ncbi:hypothetical protein [Sediminibacterium goheungense]|uniref:Uncharacterized protein n=1 Tax=Sediminibacterium goheungense TaxID=1086393 RepID=A0A4R6IXN8_9BACT|nr:hypothetical protein [Sediminibacterium goheungense]TDO26746.1 hypothetical protein BC659_2056 [Sediminibacterium goheungense]